MDGALLRLLLVVTRGRVIGLGWSTDRREGRSSGIAGSSSRAGGVDHCRARMSRGRGGDFGLHESQFDVLLVGVFVFVVFVLFFVVTAVVHLLLRLLLFVSGGGGGAGDDDGAGSWDASELDRLLALNRGTSSAGRDLFLALLLLLLNLCGDDGGGDSRNGSSSVII